MIKHVFASVDIGTTYDSPFSSFGQIVSTLLPNIFVVAGIVFLFMIAGGGLSFVLNAGQGQKEGLAKSQKALTWGVIGFIIVIGSYWLIQIIETITGIPILTPKI